MPVSPGLFVLSINANVLTFTPAGGGGDYTTSAVSFDGATELVNMALAATDNGVASISLWYRANGVPELSGNYLFVADPEGDYINYGYAAWSFDPSHIGGMELGGADAYAFQEFGAAVDQWVHVLFSVDISGDPIKACLVVNGVNVPVTNLNGNTSAYTWNGKSLHIGSDTYGSFLNGVDLADFWLAPGQSLLNGAGEIDSPTIAKFYNSGKPVDLGADGSTPTGTAPAVFLSGDASSFATNKGTGGSFAVTGALTNATSSPSD